MFILHGNVSDLVGSEQAGEYSLDPLSDYLAQYPTNQVVQPSMSTWGHLGYNEVWLNGSNDWIYRHLHKMAERMSALASRHAVPDELTRRALNQLARELCLAQSSDWAFILKTGTHTSYAYRRLQDHLARFTRLSEAIEGGRIDAAWLASLEATDNLFPFLDYRVYAPSDTGVAVPA